MSRVGRPHVRNCLPLLSSQRRKQLPIHMGIPLYCEVESPNGMLAHNPWANSFPLFQPFETTMIRGNLRISMKRLFLFRFISDHVSYSTYRKGGCIRVAQLVRACVRNAQVRVLPRVSENNMRQKTHKI